MRNNTEFMARMHICMTYYYVMDTITGSAIRRARKQKGMTQADLAGVAGCSQSTVSLIERGRRVPPGTLRSLARVLNLEPAPEGSVPATPRIGAPIGFDFPRPDARPIPLPVQVDRWQRPEHGGDILVVRPSGQGGVFIAAVDVAGHGMAAMPSAQYVEGWLSAASAPPCFSANNLVL